MENNKFRFVALSSITMALTLGGYFFLGGSTDEKEIVASHTPPVIEETGNNPFAESYENTLASNLNDTYREIISGPIAPETLEEVIEYRVFSASAPTANPVTSELIAKLMGSNYDNLIVETDVDVLRSNVGSNNTILYVDGSNGLIGLDKEFVEIALESNLPIFYDTSLAQPNELGETPSIAEAMKTLQVGGYPAYMGGVYVITSTGPGITAMTQIHDSAANEQLLKTEIVASANLTENGKQGAAQLEKPDNESNKSKSVTKPFDALKAVNLGRLKLEKTDVYHKNIQETLNLHKVKRQRISANLDLLPPEFLLAKAPSDNASDNLLERFGTAILDIIVSPAAAVRNTIDNEDVLARLTDLNFGAWVSFDIEVSLLVYKGHVSGRQLGRVFVGGSVYTNNSPTMKAKTNKYWAWKNSLWTEHYTLRLPTSYYTEIAARNENWTASPDIYFRTKSPEGTNTERHQTSSTTIGITASGGVDATGPNANVGFNFAQTEGTRYAHKDYTLNTSSPSDPNFKYRLGWNSYLTSFNTSVYEWVWTSCGTLSNQFKGFPQVTTDFNPSYAGIFRRDPNYSDTSWRNRTQVVVTTKYTMSEYLYTRWACTRTQTGRTSQVTTEGSNFMFLNWI